MSVITVETRQPLRGSDGTYSLAVHVGGFDSVDAAVAALPALHALIRANVDKLSPQPEKKR